MASLINQQFKVNAGGPWVYFDRVYGFDGELLQSADVSAVTRTIRKWNERGEVGQTTVDTLVVADVVLNVVATFVDPRNGMVIGHNFIDRVPAAKVAAKCRHTVQYGLTVDGETILTSEIDILGD